MFWVENTVSLKTFCINCIIIWCFWKNLITKTFAKKECCIQLSQEVIADLAVLLRCTSMSLACEEAGVSISLLLVEIV